MPTTSNTDSVRATVQAAINRGDVTIDDLIRQTHAGGDEAKRVLDQHFGLGTTVPLVSRWTEYFNYYKKVTTAIKQKRDQFSNFGAATTQVESGAEGRGYFQHFEKGSVFWTDQFGAHEVHGAIRDKYASMGWQKSYLGYPTTDELKTTRGGTETRYSDFEHGVIDWTAAAGAFIQLGFDVWAKRHQLGYWLHLSGQGFTAGGVVRFSVAGLTNFQGQKSTGVFAIPGPEGTFSDVVWDGRTWPAGGSAEIIALDQANGRTISRPIPALY